MFARASSSLGLATLSAARRALSTTPCAAIDFALTDEQRQLDELSKKFAQEKIIPIAAEHDRTGEYPWAIIKEAHALGLMNPHIPEKYGGLGLSSVSSTIIAENLAYGCSGIGTAIEGPALAEAPLIVGASDEQKKKYLGRMTEQPLVAAYCVSEPGAGSDVAGAKTTAVQKGDHFVINGSKTWITGAGHANWFFVLAKTSTTEKTSKAFTGFIVDADTPGVKLGKKLNMMGQRASDTRPVYFEDAVVPKENVIGAVGQGFLLAMKAFDITRPEVGSGAVGVAARATWEATKYALERKTFGVPIVQHQAVAFMLADMEVGTHMGRLMVRRAAWEMDQGRRPTYYASMAKKFAGAHVMKATTDCVQIFGGAGFCEELPVAKLMRDAKIYDLYEGANQIQSMIISRELAEKTAQGVRIEP
eukprot:c20149_g1_i1.p1 GENE.c20149_g1_i1~~c20149_g1_i1.p1  ORF type:complete len:418 (+),score=97.53 c20149_g1_i1:37-1290(+)